MPELRPTAEELERLRAAIPPDVHFGTSTWTYPGWTGLVYSKPYPASGATAKMLAEYARFPLFSTVGIDSSFYGPPKASSLTNWGKALPAGFRCVSKVWDRLTVFASKGQRNPDFLNADLFRSDIWEPYQAHFADHTGPFVFEFPTISRSDRVTPDQFAGLLDQFLGRLPTEGQYGIEIRNEDFLSPAYFAVLREHGVAHVFNSWTRMPSIGEQLDHPDSITARFIVARALLKPGRTYADAVDQFQPYDRIQEPNAPLRGDLVRLVQTAAGLRLPAYVLVNNRAEGSAPLTIAAVARMLAPPS
ncbi:MAG: DUF72 domain-containing protein [Gemmatimonadetes bacterium]|nr:DUF72 domain-containing protein [Gemmatimonadota bacterium]